MFEFKSNQDRINFLDRFIKNNNVKIASNNHFLKIYDQSLLKKDRNSSVAYCRRKSCIYWGIAYNCAFISSYDFDNLKWKTFFSFIKKIKKVKDFFPKYIINENEFGDDYKKLEKRKDIKSINLISAEASNEEELNQQLKKTLPLFCEWSLAHKKPSKVTYCFDDENMSSCIKSYKAILLKKKNMILQGAPGTGKTYSTAELALSLIDKLPKKNEENEHIYQRKIMEVYNNNRIHGEKGQIDFITFHQSIDYEEFVEGIKPVSKGNRINYIVQDGIFKNICNLAIKHKDKNYVLIIDEINRGNISKVFGELISLLEADKRFGAEHMLSVTLPYSKESFFVPSNLYVIGTMNTTDRSVGLIDYAIRRRFLFVTMTADEGKIKDENAKKLFLAVKNFLEETKYEMDIEDLMVGHSYFMETSDLEANWQYEIFPLLMEYYKDGIIKQSPQKNSDGKDIKCRDNYTVFLKEWVK